MTDAIVAENVRRAYGDTVALSDVSLSLPAGEVFALVGPNGAGKTTLVRSITGTTDYEGTIELFGEDPRSFDRSRLGLLPQEFTPHERLRARELIAYYAGLYDQAHPPGQILTDVGLTDSAGVAYEDLSGGQQRRACVGTALVNDPDLLILDEPTTGIDPAGRRQLWTLLEELAETGTTILFTTHYMAEAERLADRVGLLADGELVAVGTPAALIDAHGGETRLTIETTPAPEAVAFDLEYRTAVAGTELVVYDVGPTEIGTVVDTLTATGLEAESLTWSEPTLADVYLELAGESIERDLGRGETATPERSDLDTITTEGSS
ncbi:ABC transporter ATP-binding protein [Halorhabdus sp. CBA1104]|uniref:ABC transporter ATP-binding protein n=1 Tax=Halorhabdus sp. CBA1104 TaxID=1380432 RepID=UPI0012B39367|nr:ABC transporter ATP-binding protein [Halorhabdus sp. CBA1104]QGN07298.1 ABC transporter ATP-binding protein [Halorhabdus sp. CBA1104]